MKCDELEVIEPFYYDKEEVDAAIAELKDKIARLENVRKVHMEGIDSMVEGLKLDAEIISHQKYKRCLAMAEWCHLKIHERLAMTYPTRVDFYERWRVKWSTLADKFKES